MYLSFVLHEILDETGRVESFHIYPLESSKLIADRIMDVGSISGSNQVDLGPLRYYTNNEGIKVQRTISKLSSNAFNIEDDTINLNLRHLGLPVADNTVGFYSILLPEKYYGRIRCTLPHEEIWLKDEERLLVTMELTPWKREWKNGLEIHAQLGLDTNLSSPTETGTSYDVFKTGINGLHHSSVRNFLRAVNRGLPDESSKVFICHSSQDKGFARKISTSLVGRGIKVWLDEAEIKIGDSLIEKIENGIFDANNLIVLLSNNSVNSKWCKEELRMALSMQINENKIKVLPALLEECKIPGFLLEKTYADFTKSWRFDDSIEDICDAISNK